MKETTAHGMQEESPNTTNLQHMGAYGRVKFGIVSTEGSAAVISINFEAYDGGHIGRNM